MAMIVANNRDGYPNSQLYAKRDPVFALKYIKAPVREWRPSTWNKIAAPEIGQAFFTEFHFPHRSFRRIKFFQCRYVWKMHPLTKPQLLPTIFVWLMTPGLERPTA
jgi:hypothetical protein